MPERAISESENKPPASDKPWGCDNKFKHKNIGSARRAATSYKRSRNSTLAPYRCRYCRYWHVGHPAQKR